MKNWVFFYISHTIKNSQAFVKSSGWSVLNNRVSLVAYYIQNKEGHYLTVQPYVAEDDYWEVNDLDASMNLQATWVKDPVDAKSFYNDDEATRYMTYHRYRDCNVVKVKLQLQSLIFSYYYHQLTTPK